MPISDAARRGATALLFGLGACSSQPAEQNSAKAVAPQPTAAASDDAIPCAHGMAPLARNCTVEEATTSRGLVLTLRQPDGSFRRLLATRDGRGLVAADGAEPAHVTIVGPDLIEVTLGPDRYRMPATIRQ